MNMVNLNAHYLAYAKIVGVLILASFLIKSE